MTPFNFGDKDYLQKLNELFSMGMPRILENPTDPESAPAPVTVDRELRFIDNGGLADVMNSVNLTFNVDTLQDGWSIFIHVVAGVATVNVGSADSSFMDGPTSKTINAGNGAIISCDGANFRIFRFTTI